MYLDTVIKIIFGLFIIFILLTISLLSILSRYRNNLSLLIDNNNGTRSTITIKETSKSDGSRFNNTDEIFQYIDENGDSGLFCLKNGECKYYTTSARE